MDVQNNPSVEAEDLIWMRRNVLQINPADDVDDVGVGVYCRIFLQANQNMQMCSDVLQNNALEEVEDLDVQEFIVE